MRLEQTLQESVQVSRFLVVTLIQLMVLQLAQFLQVQSHQVYIHPGTIAATQDTAGAVESSQSYTQADAVPQSAPTVGAVGNLSDQTSFAAGTAGDLSGTVTSAGIITVTKGGAGTSAWTIRQRNYRHRLVL